MDEKASLELLPIPTDSQDDEGESSYLFESLRLDGMYQNFRNGLENTMNTEFVYQFMYQELDKLGLKNTLESIEEESGFKCMLFSSLEMNHLFPFR